MCVTAADTAVDFTHADYIPMRYGVGAAATERGSFSARGLTLSRADRLFANDLSLARDPGATQLIVDVRRAGERR
jgi:hypothetical protein